MKSFSKQLPVYLFALIVFVSCKKEPTNSLFTSFDEVFKQGGDFEEVPESRTEDINTEEDPVYNDEESTDSTGSVSTKRWVCTKKTISVTDGNSDFPLFNTQDGVIYPGALLQGKSLGDATPAPIPVKRSGGTISYSLNNGNLNSTFQVEEVKISTIRDAMNNIINNAGEVVPANFILEIKQVQSREQLALELGVKMKTFASSAEANLSYNSSQSTNSFLIKLSQSYYTMIFDLPTSTDELFHSSVTPQDLSTYVGPDNPATFIHSVTYGRIFYMLIESSTNANEMEANLKASYGKFGNGVSGELDVKTIQELENLTVKVIAYGGDAKGAISMAGETSVENIANKLAESTEIRAGLPISYVVRSVERPDITVGVKLATTYDVVNCELKGTLPPNAFHSIVDLFADDEDGGGIGAATLVGQSNILLFNKSGKRYAWYNGNSGNVLGVFDISDTLAPLGGIKLEEVGAALQFSDYRIYLFNSDGLRCQILTYTAANFTGNTLPTEPIGTFQSDIYYVDEIFGDSKNFQFLGYGFAAASRYYKDGASSPILHFFRNPGDLYADYRAIGVDGEWYNPLKPSDWGNHGLTFEKVGAACLLEAPAADNTRQLFFNEAGDEMFILRASNGKFDGPYVVN